jgi:hypothetical protein
MKTTKSVVLIFLCFISASYAQVKIGNNPKNLDPSAILEIESTNKGLLIPRLTSNERTAISNPANGLMVYQTDGVAGVYTYNSNAWQALGAAGTNGTNGVDGKTVLNGTSNPTAAIGTNGDFFINTSSNTLFGPKAAGAWPTGVSLVGPAGTNGTNGQGVPTGGTANQVLAKVDGTNYNTQWVTPATNGWSLNGNAGTTDSNFIGTTDNMGLTFRTNNIAQWLLTPKGRFVPVVPSNIFIGGGNETTTALSNTVVGSGAMINLTTGGFNTAIGDAALFAITTGVNNTAIGSTALTSTTTGSANTGTGKNALQLNSTGDGNTGIGQNALQTNTTGSNNTALGFGAGVSANNLNNATALGNGALVDASNKVRIGNDNVTATDIAGQVKVNAQSTTNNFTLPATRGTANQVLSTNGAGETSWVTSSGGGSGATLDLLATNTSSTAIFSVANGTNTGDVVPFNNVVTAPTLGSYNASTNTYTVGATGVYIIQAVTRSGDHPTTPSSTVGQFLFVDVDGVGIGSANTILTDYPTANGANFPAGSRGRGFTHISLYLTAGQTIRVLGLSANSSTAMQPLKTDGSCKFMVVKL